MFLRLTHLLLLFIVSVTKADIIMSRYIFLIISVALQLIEAYESPINLTPLNRRILTHKETNKCVTVGEDFKLFMDTCNWEKDEPAIGGIFSIHKSNRGGHQFKWTTGRKPVGIEGCLQEATPEAKEGDEETPLPEVSLVQCDPRDVRQTWRFYKPDNFEAASYIVLKPGTTRCLAIVGRSEESEGKLSTTNCNVADADQVFQICEPGHKHKQCDI